MTNQQRHSTDESAATAPIKKDAEISSDTASEGHHETGPVETPAADEPKSLEQQLLAKENQLQDYFGRLQRLQADFDNYRKRLAREQEGITRLIENRIYMKVLPIYDSFDRALRIFERDQNKEVLAEGVKFIYSQFKDLLSTENIQPMEVVGKFFDPARHEALFLAESDGPPNVVLEEFERGYQRGDQVLRPSRVKVSKTRVLPVEAGEAKPENKTEPERGEP